MAIHEFKAVDPSSVFVCTCIKVCNGGGVFCAKHMAVGREREREKGTSDNPSAVVPGSLVFSVCVCVSSGCLGLSDFVLLACGED